MSEYSLGTFLVTLDRRLQAHHFLAASFFDPSRANEQQAEDDAMDANVVSAFADRNSKVDIKKGLLQTRVRRAVTKYRQHKMFASELKQIILMKQPYPDQNLHTIAEKLFVIIKSSPMKPAFFLVKQSFGSAHHDGQNRIATVAVGLHLTETFTQVIFSCIQYAIVFKTLLTPQ